MHTSKRRWASFVVAGLSLAMVPSLTLAQDAPSKPPAAKEAPADKAPPAEPPAPVIDITAVDLRPQYIAGRITRYEFWSQRVQEITMEMAGNRRDASTVFEVAGQGVWEVVSVKPDGSAVCTFTYDHMVATVTGPDGTAQVNDSRKPSGDIEPLHQLLRSLAGMAVRYEMAADGNATSVSGVQAIRQRMPSDAQEFVPPDEDFLQTAMELATLPGVPPTLATGNNWSANYDWRHELGRLKMATQYTLSDVQEIAGIPIATVDVTARLQTIPDYSKIPADGPKVDIRQTAGTYQKQVLFDLQRHETVGSNTLRNMTHDTRITLPGGQNILRSVRETMQEQMLRVSEEGTE